MEGEMTLDIRITCAEHRKVSRTVLRVEAWSEHIDTVTLVIEDHDLEYNKMTDTKIEVPLNQLIQALEAVRMVLLA